MSRLAGHAKKVNLFEPANRQTGPLANLFDRIWIKQLFV